MGRLLQRVATRVVPLMAGILRPSPLPQVERGLVSASANLRILHELVAALDRRLPQVEHAGEAAIARDAAALRARAQARIAELEHEPTAAEPP